MKKYILTTIIVFFLFAVGVNAKETVPNFETYNLSLNAEKVFAKTESDTCESLLGDPDPDKPDAKNYPAYWIQWGLNLIKYIAIVALLGLSTMDFFKALVADDKDAIKKASTTTVKRFVYTVIIFFLPILVEVLMKLFGLYGTCGIG